MKKLILIASLFFSVQSFSQIIPKGSIPIVPVVFLSDTAYSVGWQVNRISSDTTIDSYGEVYIYSGKGVKIYETGFVIPKSVINNWGTDNSAIDNFIFNKFPQLKRK